MPSDRESERSIQDGDVVEVRERMKIVGFEGPDVLLMNVETGQVTLWDGGLFDRPGVEVTKVDDE